MSDERVPPDEREEPPFVLATMMRASARVEQVVRGGMQALNMRLLMFVWAAGTVALFLFVVVSSIAQTPGWEGVVQGIFGGGFIALLFAAGFGWFLLWARGKTSTRDAEGPARARELDALLAPTLRELNAVRADVIRQVKARSVTRIPLGVAAAFGVWVLAQTTDDPPGWFELLMFVVFGALAGEVWAFSKLEREYHRLYKSRVLPALASRLGELTYREASAQDVQQLAAFRILPQYDSVRAEDEISGVHRGLRVRIIQASLQRRSNNSDRDRNVFDGLLIEIMLPRSLTGTTAVVTDEGFFGNLKASWQSTTMQPVRLEDPHFEKRFEVYSTDQIEARALLTPAFMERFLALASASGFSLPGALAEGSRLVVALPKSIGMGNLFEPPAYWKPAGGQALVRLERDIANVLRVAETVAQLDFFAAANARAASRPSR